MQQRFRFKPTPLKPICLMVLQALACHAYAADGAAVNAAAPEADAAPLQVIEVTGQGQTRQVQNISRDDMLKLVPGTSALKALEKLPGVNFESADPFGAYEWSTRFNVRGFSQNQLGFTLDGVPLGDMSYGNNNGLHISRAISSENIGRVALSQGAGSLGTASTSNLGGTVQFYTLNPSDERAITASQTVGSDSTSRTFVRVDSGEFASGTKFYLSGTAMRADKWKGDGPQDQDQFNSKIVHRFGDNTLSAFYNYSSRKETDYQDMSLEMIGRLGSQWDNYAPDFQRAVNAARGVYTGGVTSLDDAYYSAGGVRKDNLGGVSLDLALTPSMEMKTTVYHHDNKGQGLWYTPYVATSATMPISIRTTEYSISRNGATADLTWHLGSHTLNGGFWAERSDHTLTRNYYGVTDGDARLTFLSNPFRTDFKQDFTTTTRQYYLQDTVTMLDNRLTLNFGFKGTRVAIDARTLIGTRAAGDLESKKSFLPQAGLNYRINRDLEVFTSVSKTMRAFQPGVDGPFSQTQTAYNANVNNLKPETSTNFDLGLRFQQDAVQGSVALYRTDFKDRQLGLATCAGIVGCASTIANVGKVQTQGVEALAVWKFAPQLSWLNTYTFNDSKYKSDYTDGATVVRTAGKEVVNAPRTMFNTELSYENPVWFARVGAKYTAKRYYTYLNDADVPSFWNANLSSGYKLGKLGAFKEVALQFNVSNLFDKDAISTVGTNGFAASDPGRTLMTLLPGAPRQFYLTLSGKL
jgi:iron complex outermembrane receptor protein